MAVFDGVQYSLSASLSPARRTELAAVLDVNGAAPHPPYTHVVCPHASHAHPTDAAKLVTDRWVDRSVVMGKRQPEQYYSPNPTMIFSGVVACATDLSTPDLEVLSAGITALGGQWRIGLTRDVTHLFALRAGSDKFNTAVHFAPQTNMCIVTPHWFDDAVRLGRRVPETPYAWPDPPVLRPGLVLDLDKDPQGKRKRKTPTDADAEAQDLAVSSRVWADRRILLSPSLELTEGSRRAIEAGIQRAGGVVVPISEDADEDAEENAVDQCDVFVTRWRSGIPYFKAARASLLIGSLSWLFSVESSGTLHSPLDSLLWYPTPRGGIPDLTGCEISITNYTGAARDYLKRLIVLMGAKFTPSMSQSNKVLVAGFQPSPKTTRALSWSIPVVNHTWLEDCFVEWRALTVGLERYIVYPPGVDFGKLLMTRPDDAHPSQTVSVPRVNGGAVPGGRGVGIIDLEREESRDAEYPARTQDGEFEFGLSAMHEAFANDTTTDGISMILEGDVPTEPRGRARSRAGSVKKTPSSAKRRRSISNPKATSVTGLFVDRVIELPSDDEGEGRRRSVKDGKRRVSKSPAGTRASSRSASRSSSVSRPRKGKKGETVERESKGTPSGGKGTQKDPGKRRTTRAQVADQDEHAAQPTSPKPKSRPVQRKPDNRTAQTEEEDEERELPRSRKPPRRVKGMAIGSDLDSDAESETSVPPRKASGTGSATPVKSGMKPRPRSKSRSTPGADMNVKPVKVGGDTIKRREEPTRSSRNSEPASQENRQNLTREKKERGGAHRQSTTRSPSPPLPGTQTSSTAKRQLSVLVPPVPKDYFTTPLSSREPQDRSTSKEKGKMGASVSATSGPKKLAPAESMRVVAAEASTSTSKRGKPVPKPKLKPRVSKEAAKAHTDDEDEDDNDISVSTNKREKPVPKPKFKPRVSKEATKAHTDDDDEDDNDISVSTNKREKPVLKSKLKPRASKEATKTRAADGDEEDHNDTSMVVDSPVASTSRGGPRRGAASKATTRLREVVMPDLVNFENEQKKAKRRRSTGGGESVVSAREDEEEETIERVGKKRKTEPEEDEEAEVEDVVSVPLTKAKQKSVRIKKGSNGVDSDAEAESAATSKLKGSQERATRSRGKESATIRVITTGVSLSDDVIKRLAKLGVQMTTKPTDCTHLVAKGIVRTEKFLCAMSVSPYILTEAWANESAQRGKLLDESDYLLSDAAAERKWDFNLADAMERAKGRAGGPNLFKQVTFYVTPKVAVDAKLFKHVVIAGGGQVQTSTTPTVRILKGKPKRYVVSCAQDKSIWRPLVEEGFTVYSPELVLRAALRQEIEWEREDSVVAG